VTSRFRRNAFPCQLLVVKRTTKASSKKSLKKLLTKKKNYFKGFCLHKFDSPYRTIQISHLEIKSMATEPKPLQTQQSLARELASTAFATSYKVQVYRSPFSPGLVFRRVAWNNAGTRLVCTHNDRSIRAWTTDKPDTKSSVEIRSAHERPVEDISWNPLHADQLASCSTDGTIKLWDIRTKKYIRKHVINGEILVIRYSTDGNHIAVALRDDRILVLDADLGAVVATYQETDEVYGLAWSNGSNLLAGSLGNGNVRLLWFNGQELTVAHTLRGHRTATGCLEFDPKGNCLAIGSNEGIVSIWDTNDWICIKTFAKTDQPVTSISYSFDGQYMAIASDNNGTIDIVHVASGTYIYTLPKQNYVGRPAVRWHPLRMSLAFTGDPNGVSVFS
jgi:THO complex subunit 3